MDESSTTTTTTTMPAPPRHWKLTAEQYQRMGETGILHEDDHVELLEGELYEKSPIGSWHNGCVSCLTWWLGSGIGRRAIVLVQGSFRLSPDAEPQPDLLVLRFRPDFYEQALAGPEDMLLLVEVADTTLAYDRDIKLPLYARAGIPEVWIVNRAAECIEVYRGPQGNTYRSIEMMRRGGSIAPPAFPDVTVQVSDILG